jgi:hypothetical protein
LCAGAIVIARVAPWRKRCGGSRSPHVPRASRSVICATLRDRALDRRADQRRDRALIARLIAP